MTSDKFRSGQRVWIWAIGPGLIVKVRHDSLGHAIYSVKPDQCEAVTDGIFYARECELREL